MKQCGATHQPGLRNGLGYKEGDITHLRSWKGRDISSAVPIYLCEVKEEEIEGNSSGHLAKTSASELWKDPVGHQEQLPRVLL